MASTSHRKRQKKKKASSSINFADKFRLPTPKQSQNAVGSSELPNYLKPSDQFQPVPKPTCEIDWLAMYSETGQTFNSFLKTCPWLSGRKIKYAKQRFVPTGINVTEKYPDGLIYIQPLGDFGSVSSPSIEDLSRYAESFFSLPVAVLPSVNLTLPTYKGNFQAEIINTANNMSIFGIFNRILVSFI